MTPSEDFESVMVSPHDTARDMAKIQLLQELSQGDFYGAMTTLKRAGSCQWPAIIDKDMLYAGDRTFMPHFSQDILQTTLELRERTSVDYSNLHDQYVPVLTISQPNCKK